MSLIRSKNSLFRAAIGPALMVVVLGVFIGNALLGVNGLLALDGYRQKMAVRKAELTALEQQRDRLANSIALLNPKATDPDYAEELVRKETRQIRPDEVIILDNQK
ncbi:MAG: septum formation initiator family protein [Zymomonas mobilis]|nr:septum formation initiator family protein [Zymomonas mobilis]